MDRPAVAAELVGAHVGAPVSHTTGSVTGLPLRLITSLFGHAGIEWDLSAVPDVERLRSWAGLYKELRGLLHSGATVRVDDPGEGALLHGVVGSGARCTPTCGSPAPPTPRGPGCRCPGSTPTRRYRVRVRTEVGELPSFARRSHGGSPCRADR